jgi:hypothetical protein
VFVDSIDIPFKIRFPAIVVFPLIAILAFTFTFPRRFPTIFPIVVFPVIARFPVKVVPRIVVDNMDVPPFNIRLFPRRRFPAIVVFPFKEKLEFTFTFPR